MLDTTATIVPRCHYEVLGISIDATAREIKQAHRAQALAWHPDKNAAQDTTEQFRLIQEAYECLTNEKEWYDEHREAILRGWTTDDTTSADHFLCNLMPYMMASCYNGYHNGDKGFFSVYANVFQTILDESGVKVVADQQQQYLSPFGTSTSSWEAVSAFYQGWESYTSNASFAWADEYASSQEAPNRQVRRAMDEENKKARRKAKKERNEQVLALVRFVKRRDPRVLERKKQLEQEKFAKDQQQLLLDKQRKEQALATKLQWQQQAAEHMAAAQEADLMAGRIRLADLDDDYDYGGGSGKKKKGKKKKKQRSPSPANNTNANNDDAEESNQATDEQQQPNDENNAIDETMNDLTVSQQAKDSDEDPTNLDKFAGDDSTAKSNDSNDVPDESSSEPDVWRCECCRKDFKSHGQMENHMASKKHKVAYKKFLQENA